MEHQDFKFPTHYSKWKKYLIGTDTLFCCRKSGHKVRDYPNLKGQQNGSGQAQASNSNVHAPKQNLFYCLRFMGDQETSPVVMTGISNVFSIDVFALLDHESTLYFVTPFVASKIDILLNVLNEKFMVTTSVGDLVVPKRGYKIFSTMMPIELVMLH